MTKLDTSSKNYFVYIVECSDGTYYTGITTNVERRLKAHNGIITGGAKYTSKRRPVELLAVSKRLKNRSEASKLEHVVKKQKKSKKVEYLLNYKTHGK